MTGTTPDEGALPTVRPRVVATDLDGTLLRSDGTVSDRTVGVLTALVAAGVHVLFVTGRPVRWMRPVADAVGHTGLALCANGAVVYDLAQERVVETFALDHEIARQVTDTVRSQIPGVAFAVESAARGFGHEADYRLSDIARRFPAQQGTLEDLLDGPVLKLLIRHETLDPDTLLERARAVTGGLAELTHSSAEGLLEVSAAGVTKASTLATVAGRLGADAEHVVAFGDMPNDLPMLAWAGTSYAMTDAHPAVLDAVRLRAPRNDDDGVARTLERIFDLDPPGVSTD